MFRKTVRWEHIFTVSKMYIVCPSYIYTYSTCNLCEVKAVGGMMCFDKEFVVENLCSLQLLCFCIETSIIFLERILVSPFPKIQWHFVEKLLC